MAEKARSKQELLAVVRRAWAEVLNTSEDAIRDNDNFFQGPGDSFAAVLLCTYVQERTGIEMTLPQFLSSPTISGLTDALYAAERSASFATR
jgi:acyl carrier protein